MGVFLSAVKTVIILLVCLRTQFLICAKDFRLGGGRESGKQKRRMLLGKHSPFCLGKTGLVAFFDNHFLRCVNRHAAINRGFQFRQDGF